jgi:Uma2 family endonuclease
MDAEWLEEDEALTALAESDDEEDEVPNFIHGEAQLQTINALNASLQQGLKAYPPISFQGIHRRYTPDVVVYPQRGAPREKASEAYRIEQTPPLLAMEIVSPAQTMYAMILKCAEMLDAGVEECWILEPSNETVTVCRKDTQFVRHRGAALSYAHCTQTLSVDALFDVP